MSRPSSPPPPGTPGPLDGKRRPGAASKEGPEDAAVPPAYALPKPPCSEPAAPLLQIGPPRPVPPAGARGREFIPDRARQDAWVARLREGDGQALREVVEAFSERITAVVTGMLHDRDAVEDVVHETFVKAFFRIRSFKGDSGLFTWLYRVAINGAKDHAKRKRRRPVMALEDLGPAGSAIEAPTALALEPLERRETRLAVRAAVQALPAKFRAVIVLRELEGLKYEEIAAILDISQGTVESRLFRARKRLRARLLRYDDSRGAPHEAKEPQR